MRAGMKEGETGYFGGVKLERAQCKYFKHDRCLHCFFEDNPAACMMLGCFPSRNINLIFRVYEPKRHRRK